MGTCNREDDQCLTITKFDFIPVPANPTNSWLSEGPDFKETDLEERCRLGRGLGVSFLRLWPGEWLSPRWPLQETRSLLQENRI